MQARLSRGRMGIPCPRCATEEATRPAKLLDARSNRDCSSLPFAFTSVISQRRDALFVIRYVNKGRTCRGTIRLRDFIHEHKSGIRLPRKGFARPPQDLFSAHNIYSTVARHHRSSSDGLLEATAAETAHPTAALHPLPPTHAQLDPAARKDAPTGGTRNGTPAPACVPRPHRLSDRRFPPNGISSQRAYWSRIRRYTVPQSHDPHHFPCREVENPPDSRLRHRCLRITRGGRTAIHTSYF